jgi:hypothetical protein
MKERKQEFVRMNQTQINETKSKKWCKRLPLLAAFLIPLLISVIICIDHEVYPFGERCLLQVDMYHQYCPFFTEFVDKLRSGVVRLLLCNTVFFADEHQCQSYLSGSWNGRWKEFLLYQRRVAFDLFHAFLKICDRGQCNGGKPAAYPCGVIREHVFI